MYKILYITIYTEFKFISQKCENRVFMFIKQ